MVILPQKQCSAPNFSWNGSFNVITPLSVREREGRSKRGPVFEVEKPFRVVAKPLRVEPFRGAEEPVGRSGATYLPKKYNLLLISRILMLI